MWNVGWSHGKEKLGEDPDVAKGSFYSNPLYDVADVPLETKQKYPFAYPDNIWPKTDIPELESAVKSQGKIMYDVIVLFSKHVDRYLSSILPTYSPNTLYDLLSKTKKIKSRLLYYFPCDSPKDDAWIGWHNDSGFLTGLMGAIFFDDTTGEIIPNPDPLGGLWVVDRGNEPVLVRIPGDEMGIQCGECLQILSGGRLLSTPHCVRPSHCPGKKVGRAAFPVFVDSDIEYGLFTPKGVKEEEVYDRMVESKVPPLRERWKGNGQIFADFLGDTFRKYYEWTK